MKNPTVFSRNHAIRYHTYSASTTTASSNMFVRFGQFIMDKINGAS